jgi:predicted membrane protein
MTRFLSIKELLPDDFTDDASSLPAWRMTAATWWAISRILHGALWLAVIAYYFYFWIDPKDHFNQLGSLRLSTEVLMLGLPMAAVCMGFFQMAMRDRAGFRRHSAPLIPQR